MGLRDDPRMEDPMVVTRSVSVPLSEIELRVSRSSGPGGQHANVTASRVEAVFDVAGSPSLSEAQRKRVMAKVGPRLAAVAQDTRSQARNRELALERLRSRLGAGLGGPRAGRAPAPATPPSPPRRHASSASSQSAGAPT